MPSGPWQVEHNMERLEVFKSRLDKLLAGWAQTSLIQPWGRRRDQITSRLAFFILTSCLMT